MPSSPVFWKIRLIVFGTLILISDHKQSLFKFHFRRHYKPAHGFKRILNKLEKDLADLRCRVFFFTPYFQ
ncbi:MAG: hypothetical protein D6714_02085 [Bacteroidetes bacterium]|nr:MAG: hypothetical protein D6714_02085 [Bacteroidota bacterium]